MTVLDQYLYKKWSIEPSNCTAAIIIFTALLSVITWLRVMSYRVDLAWITMLWTGVVLPTTVLLGVVVFGERMSMLHWAGCCLIFLGALMLSGT